MLTKITQRGPEAYNILIEILRNNKFNSALDKLNVTNQSIRNNRNNINTNNNIPRNITPRRPSTSSSFKSQTKTSSELNGNDHLPLVPEQIPHADDNNEQTPQATSTLEIEQYSMNKRKKGVLFLVNITKFECDVETERRGAHFDTTNLIHLFDKLDFHVFKFEDISKSQFQKILNELLDSDYCKQAQCFVMVLMSHGQMIDRKIAFVKFYDNHREEVYNIMDNFSNKNCPSLIKKPKILFFPFCR